MIRPATPDDVPAMTAMERSCASAAHWTPGQYLDALDSSGVERLVLVAEAPVHSASNEAARSDAGGLQGFLVARHVAAEWELENIVVAPSARRNGLGQRLLGALLAAARETNSSSVFLEVRESNAPARNLYEKAGFEQTGRRKSYYADPAENAILYRFSLE
ncbi:MAG: ribosomal protein S18-alanine N-acetyltransferase [Candidatus Sulfotelmatobacter sp.]